MPRSSIALFLAATGLITGMAGCGKAPEPGDTQTPAVGQPTPGGGKAVKYHSEKGRGEGSEGGEGGEGGEG